MDRRSPLLNHPWNEESAFTPEKLVAAVQVERGLPAMPPARIGVLDFDGDLTDWLIREGLSRRSPAWACFHTAMEEVEIDGERVGVVARAIGGPYAVLIAEQMAASGVEAILGLTSAGRVSPSVPLPSLIVAERALRDEGTSLHYLPPDRFVDAPAGSAETLATELADLGPPVLRGALWTTDAPYRETATQLAAHARDGLLAVEMQAASLFAFAAARRVRLGVVAHVTNAADNDGKDFDKGDERLSFEILRRLTRAGRRWLDSEDRSAEGT